jgi:drug/metabolite transporter (DMT)-like permease
MVKRKYSWKSIIILQGIIAIYTIAGIMGKFASGYEFLSTGFILYYGCEILILGVYAVLWQQAIKRFELSVAYANRSIALMWSLIWSVLFFRENVTLTNIIGGMIIIAGTMIVNGDQHE